MRAYTVKSIRSAEDGGWLRSQVFSGIEVSMSPNNGGIVIRETGTKFPVRPPPPPIVRRKNSRDYLEEGIGIVVPPSQGARKYFLTENGTDECLFHLALWVVSGGVCQEFLRPHPMVRVIAEDLRGDAADRIALLAILERGQELRAKVNLGKSFGFLTLSCCRASGEPMVTEAGRSFFKADQSARISP